MRVIAVRDFTLAGENHAKGEVFEVDHMRGEAWKVAGVVREATDEEAEQPGRDATEDIGIDPRVKRIIDEEDND